MRVCLLLPHAMYSSLLLWRVTKITTIIIITNHIGIRQTHNSRTHFFLSLYYAIDGTCTYTYMWKLSIETIYSVFPRYIFILFILFAFRSILFMLSIVFKNRVSHHCRSCFTFSLEEKKLHTFACTWYVWVCVLRHSWCCFVVVVIILCRVRRVVEAYEKKKYCLKNVAFFMISIEFLPPNMYGLSILLLFFASSHNAYWEKPTTHNNLSQAMIIFLITATLSLARLAFLLSHRSSAIHWKIVEFLLIIIERYESTRDVCTNPRNAKYVCFALTTFVRIRSTLTMWLLWMRTKKNGQAMEKSSNQAWAKTRQPQQKSEQEKK